METATLSTVNTGQKMDSAVSQSDVLTCTG